MEALLIGIIIGLLIIISIGLIFLFINKKKYKHINILKKEINSLIIQREEEKNILKETQAEYALTISKNTYEESKLNNNRKECSRLNDEISNKKNELEHLIEIYNKQTNTQKEKIQQEIADSKKEQIKLMQEELNQYTNEINKQKQILTDEYNKEKENFDNILQDYRSKRESIIKINKEEEEIRENAKFYTLNIPSKDVADIEILERVKPSLSRPDILSKLIYKTYYEKPYTDLVGRVIGTDKKTGIYKITNLINGKVYIGQAVDIAERWRQHIKRAVGAEPITTNKLYPIMQETGPYNFSWQIVEECSKDELTSKEKYWIKYYDGQGYGYNIKG